MTLQILSYLETSKQQRAGGSGKHKILRTQRVIPNTRTFETVRNRLFKLSLYVGTLCPPETKPRLLQGRIFSKVTT